MPCDGLATERFTEFIMGAEVVVQVEGPDARSRLAAARLAMEEIRACDAALSDWQRSSERSRLPVQAGVRAGVSDRLAEAVRASLAVASATDGRFDPTISPVVDRWRTARRQGQLPSQAELDAALQRVGWQRVHLARRADGSEELWFDADDMRLDFGGIGKGFAAARASTALLNAGHPVHLVAVAGDLVAGPIPPCGTTGWRVEREDGMSPAETFELLGGAVSTSGDLEQFIEIDGIRHSHLIDPSTGNAVRGRTAASVWGPDGGCCDALATALCVAGVDGAADIMRRFPQYRAQLTTSDDGGPRRWSSRGPSEASGVP